MKSLINIIRHRQSARTPFDPGRAIDRKDLQQILEAGSWAPTAHNMQNFELIVVDDKDLISRIRELDFPASETFIQENYLQLSFSEAELKSRRTGVLSTMFPKSWLTPGLIPEQNRVNEPEHPLLERHHQLLSCPMLVLMLYNPARRAPASAGDFLGVMSLGCVLENMWLVSASLGLGLHVVSALSGETVEPAVKTLLHIPDQLRIAIAFRLGYPLAAPDYLRVRRDTGDFVHFNRFGRKGILVGLNDEVQSAT
ncbi:MAG TPA: nitroreductase family protein [Puia sp.]|nr:nitroreductase family protein [Puia sp.]